MIAPLLIEAAVTGPMRRSLGRTLLAIIAIALGVALGLAIYLINRSAADEISLAARSLYGLADLAVDGGAEGFDENLYPSIARIPGVVVASPVVEVSAKLVGRRGALTLMGLDGFRSRLLQPAIATALVPASSGSTEQDSSDDQEFEERYVLLSASAARVRISGHMRHLLARAHHQHHEERQRGARQQQRHPGHEGEPDGGEQNPGEAAQAELFEQSPRFAQMRAQMAP